jgi:2-oxoglutarate ferredoxin oxidoreductase subunit beta
VNPELTVIAESGDGDMFGEGGNHFTHTIRRNPDITNIVHDNMIYGLTKGQASPTSREGMVTPVQTSGVILTPFNPISTAIALGAGFVARTFSKDMELTKKLMVEAIKFKGYALLDIFQPCVSFNKLNTYQWFEEHITPIDSDHDPTNRERAFHLSLKEDPLPVGIFYKKEENKAYHELLDAFSEDKEPLWKRNLDRREKLEQEIRELR